MLKSPFFEFLIKLKLYSVEIAATIVFVAVVIAVTVKELHNLLQWLKLSP